MRVPCPVVYDKVALVTNTCVQVSNSGLIHLYVGSIFAFISIKRSMVAKRVSIF